MAEEWITKAQAAAILQCDERTIERRARAGRIASKQKPGFPTLYRAADVAILSGAGSQEVRTGVLEAAPAVSANGNGAVASLRHRSPSFEESVVELIQTAQRVLAQGATGPTNAPTGPTSPVKTKYVSLVEASVLSGLSEACLRRKIANGTLTAERDRGWKVLRVEVEP